MICHGNGDLTRDGCCYVAGQVCPLRWKIIDGHVYDSTGTLLGTIQQVAQNYGANKPQRDRVASQLQGVTFLCRAVVDSIKEDPKLVHDRAALNDAWHSHPEYISLVRPEWARLEGVLGLAEDEYNCGTWKGTGGPQCCFAESIAENDAKAQSLHSDAKEVRQAGGI